MNVEKVKTGPTCIQNCQSYFSEYCMNASMHGFKFLGERNRSIIERLWWFTILLTSLFFCVTNILEAYHKWQVSPVVVSFATSETPVWEIPFPAITICPEVKTIKNAVNFTQLVMQKKKDSSLTIQEQKDLSYMSLICSNRWRDHAEKEQEILTEDFYDFLFKVQPKVDDTIDECVWAARNCTDNILNLFTPLITRDGICFSFNLLDRKDIFTEEVAQNYYSHYKIPNQKSTTWSLDKGYSSGYEEDSMPRRTFLAGVAGGLQLTFWAETENLDYICGDGLQGYKVIIHGPSQIPFTKQKFVRVGLNEVLVAAVKPMLVKTSKQLKSYHPNNRECYFQEEKRLRFFKAYDQSNCLHECLSNFTFRRCGCVSFEMPRLNSTPICGYGKNSCMAKAAGEMFLMDQTPNASDDNDVPNFIEQCDCRQTCSSINFEVETSQIEWKWQKMAKMLSNSQELARKNEYTKIQIFFKDTQFITSERNELYGLMDFLSSCGGLLGLFIGFSIISLVEIIYFSSLRLICNYRKFGSHYWSGDSDLLQLKVE